MSEPDEWPNLFANECVYLVENRAPFAEARSRFQVLLAGHTGDNGLPAAEKIAQVRTWLRDSYPEETAAEFAESLPKWKQLPTIDEVLASMPPPGERLATGIGPLDTCSRGGFARGRVYTFVAAPGKGKTALIAQLSRKFAKDYGAVVIGLFVDEGSWQAALMMCEGAGFERDRLENEYDAIRGDVQEKTRPLEIRLPHPDDPKTNLEWADSWLEEIEPGRLVVVGIDSAQKVRLGEAIQPQTKKDQADAVMARARQLASRHNAVVLVASKANRASWANKNPGENMDPLAAGLDSSSIEYDSDALFFLTGDPAKKSYLVVCKNRPGDGTRPTIALGFDRTRATFAHIDEDVAEAQAEEQQREAAEAEWSSLERRVLAGVKRYPGNSGNALAKLLKINRGDLGAVLKQLERKKKVRQETEGKTQFWFPGVSDDEDLS